jgi:RimJ/RimL family protein N-acetyltransferase
LPVSSIRTPRLLLRPFSPDDAPALKQAIDENLEHLRPWMSWAMHEPTPVEGVVERLARYARDFEEGADWVYAVLDGAGERMLGVVGVHVRPGPGEREIGYWLRGDCEGKGYMSEAVAALARAAFERHGARRVEIRCDPHNARSIAVARRLGFRHEATLQANTVTPAGEPRDTMIWAVTSPAELA